LRSLLRISLRSRNEGRITMRFFFRIRTWFAALALFLTLLRAQAHDPFDASVRLTVRESDLTATVTLGVDAARQLLSAGGLSKEQVSDFVRQRGPHSILKLPPNVAAHCLVIDAETKPLIATNATILSEGLESIITLTYPRPHLQTVNVRVVFYEEIAQMRPGSFIATDEDGHQLGVALLSRASLTAKLPLPPKKNAGPSPASTNKGSVVR
jgi:hypothetical protein